MSENNELFRVLIAQHRELDDLLTQLARTDASQIDKRAALFEMMKAKLLSHAKAEEKTFYMALRSAGESGDARHAEREHKDIENALRAADECDYDDADFLDKIGELTQCVTHHVEEEESDVFESAAESMDTDDLDHIAEEFLAQQKEELAALGVPDDGYDELTREELLEKAKGVIPGSSSMSKVEIITHLREG